MFSVAVHVFGFEDSPWLAIARNAKRASGMTRRDVPSGHQRRGLNFTAAIAS